MTVVALTRESYSDMLGVKMNAAGLFDSASIEYLWAYLEELRGGADAAATVVLEDRYVDRHFLDDFANYYARAFRVPAAHCKRLHFFRDDEASLRAQLDLALGSVGDARANARAHLIERYLGFVVVRPLASAPVGRTVLRTYPPDGRRQYTTTRSYKAHLYGLTFEVAGLAYQQQDGGAAVCASTALWSSLQQIARIAGHRTPTPSEITEASGTPFAASYGLDDRQMATALASLGYAADHFSPAENRLLFRAKLAVALESRLPVVLLISKREPTGAGMTRVGHAVAVTGYAIEGDAQPVLVAASRAGVPRLPMLVASLRTIYVHDDNLGSHAHYELFD
jgi:hypothetical protein